MGSHFSRTYSKSILYKLLGVLSALFMCIPSCSKEELIWEELLAVLPDTSTVVIVPPVPTPDPSVDDPAPFSQYSALSFLHQSAAVYGDYLFLIKAGRSSICMFDLANKQDIYTLSLRGENQSIYHCNQSSFGGEKYDSLDVFPPLYVSQRPKSGNRCFVEVFRIIPGYGEDSLSVNSFKIELIQQIFMPPMTKDNSLGSVNCVVDPDHGWLYTYSRNDVKEDDNYGQCKISRFAVPDVHRKIVDLSDADIESSFMINTSAVYMQGGCLVGDLLMIGQGGPGLGFTCLNVIDLKKRELMRQIDLLALGFKWEPEGCFYYDGSVMISHSTSIDRIKYQ